jgi:hypothetical protein
VNVSNFFAILLHLNGYGVFILHFFQDYEIASLKPYEAKTHVIFLALRTSRLLDYARKPIFLKLCAKGLAIATP